MNSRAPEVRVEQGQWFDLFNGRDLSGWRVFGSAQVRQGRITLTPGRESKTILISTQLNEADGVVEVVFVRQAGPEGRGPFTISVRTYPDILDWRAAYVVCRSRSVEIVRGGRNEAPDHVAKGVLEPMDGRERFTIRMAGPRIECYRQGKRVTVYRDPLAEKGTVCLTADGVNVEVLSVRYRPLEAGVESARNADRPDEAVD
jgi:hypothetical protein